MKGKASSSAFRSPIFEISVGEPAELFHAHADILAKSEMLKETVHGPWKENKEARLQWNEWEPDVVDKFLEWLYTEDYVCPDPVEGPMNNSASQHSAGKEGEGDHSSAPRYDQLPEMEPAEPELQVIPAPDDGWGGFGFASQPSLPSRKSLKSRKEKKYKEEPVLHLPSLEDLTWNGCSTLKKRSQAEEFDIRNAHLDWGSPSLDFEATFLTHAKLYVMACFYRLPTLQNMAWQRLRSVFISIKRPNPGTPVIDNLAILISYVYFHTGVHSPGVEEPLRMLVTAFAAMHFTQLKGARWNELMHSTEEGDREFMGDFLAKVQVRMALLERSQKTDEKVKSSQGFGWSLE
ncbi:MAG: hypothetical protein Q9219_004669 [cf. Caloplaca sp. 3 TL-2023]